MLSGIFEPEEVLKMTSTTLFATLIEQALRGNFVNQ